MVIYEVNLTVQPRIAAEMATWLREHLKEMLEIDGFERASIFERRPDDEGVEEEVTLWTCHYEVRDRASLERYFQVDAARMRQDGVARFGDGFSASRRILERSWAADDA